MYLRGMLVATHDCSRRSEASLLCARHPKMQSRPDTAVMWSSPAAPTPSLTGQSEAHEGPPLPQALLRPPAPGGHMHLQVSQSRLFSEPQQHVITSQHAIPLQDLRLLHANVPSLGIHA